MVTNLADYEAMFANCDLKFPHRITLYCWPEQTTLHVDAGDLEDHKLKYHQAIALLQETLGQFQPSVMVKLSKDRTVTFIEVIPRQDMMEHMRMLQ